jgi:hypothetical protein
MRHPFTTQLRRARTAAAIEARNRPAQGAGPGGQVPRLLVWSGVTLLVALAALGVLLPAGTALGGVADERGPAGRTGAGDHQERHPAGAGGAVELLQPRHPDVAGGTEGSDAGGRHPARAVRAVDLLPRHSHVAGGTQGLDAGEGTGRHLDSAACPGPPGATGRAERAANLARRLAWGPGRSVGARRWIGGVGH